MTITFRHYDHDKDYHAVGEFLIAHHQAGNLDGNWLQPAWEYMHFHPALQAGDLGKIGIWEEAGEMIAVCHYEWRLGEAFFQFHPDHRRLRQEMLNYAEAELTSARRQEENRYLCAYVNDNDPDFLEVVRARGYHKDPTGARRMLGFSIPNPFPPIHLPAGFRLTSLAEDCDWAKVHQVLWRGFDHGDDVPMNQEEFESRQRMFDTPTARRDLKIAVASPEGDFVSFAGIFFEPRSKFAYIEPVATDPKYRRLGLGKAAVLEGIRRSAGSGAKLAYVGNDLPIYRAVGFERVYTSECWVKVF